MHKRFGFTFLVPAFFIAGLVACGSGDTTVATGNGGIGGTGFVSGSISGFGSVFVNGVEFETGSTTITVDGVDTTQSALQIGMVVRVSGDISADSLSGTAATLRYDEAVQGQVSSAPQANADNTQKILRIFGLNVIASANGTNYRNTSYATLASNDLLEVSGFFDTNGDLHATFIDKKGVYPANREGEITGTIENLDNTALTFGIVGSGLTVSFSGSVDLSGITGGVLGNGQYVEVEGSITSAATLAANTVEEEDDGLAADADNAKVEGFISNYINDASFTVAGISVNASGSTVIRLPGTLVLANGQKVEVQGPVVNGVIVAEKVEAESGEVKIYANISSVDSSASTVTLVIPGMSGGVLIEINNKTEIEDELGNVDSPREVFALAIGTFIRIEGYESSNNRVIAKQFKRDAADTYMLQGVVDDWDGGSELSILGFTMSTAGATSFERSNNTRYANAAGFYADLDVGSDVVKVVDKDLNGSVDEVEYE